MDKNKVKEALKKKLKQEMSMTGTGASVTSGNGEGVATKYAFGKSTNGGTPKDWKAAPSIPNRKSKAIDYKQLFEGDDLDAIKQNVITWSKSRRNAKQDSLEVNWWKHFDDTIMNATTKKEIKDAILDMYYMGDFDWNKLGLGENMNEAKQEWAIQNITALINDYATNNNLTFTPVDKKQQTNQYGSKKTIYIYKLGDKDLVMVDDKSAGAPRLNDFKVVIGTMEPGTSVLKNSMSVSKNAYTGMSDITKMLDKAFENKELNENYARFRNETKTRTKPEQFHNAVKSVKQKVNEINRLFEYMNRLQSELSESDGGLKHKKYTDKAIQSIKESTKQLFFKSTKLK